MVNVLVSEIRKNKRSKALAISALLIVVYEVITVFYTVRAVGLFDNFMYLYKFALSYMDFLILPMILLSFITAIFSTDYKSDTIKYLWTIPVSKKRFFFAQIHEPYLLKITATLASSGTKEIIFYMRTQNKAGSVLEKIKPFFT